MTDGTDRRGFLECMAWAGTGVLWTVPAACRNRSPSAAVRRNRRRRDPQLRSDQRQPHRLRQGGEPRRQPRRCARRSPDQPVAGAPGVRPPHGRRHPSLEARGVRHSPSDPQGRQDRPAPLRARRARRARRTSGKTYLDHYGKGTRARAGTASISTACTSSAWSTSLNLKAGGLGNLGDEQLEWLEDDVQASGREHADRGVRAHPALDASTPSGAGAPRTPRRRSAISSGSARSPCSTATSIR